MEKSGCNCVRRALLYQSSNYAKVIATIHVLVHFYQKDFYLLATPSETTHGMVMTPMNK